MSEKVTITFENGSQINGIVNSEFRGHSLGIFKEYNHEYTGEISETKELESLFKGAPFLDTDLVMKEIDKMIALIPPAVLKECGVIHINPETYELIEHRLIDNKYKGFSFKLEEDLPEDYLFISPS